MWKICLKNIYDVCMYLSMYSGGFTFKMYFERACIIYDI